MVQKKQAIVASLWEFSGRISGNIISLGFSVVLARILSPEDFGTIAILIGIINIASSLWDAGLGGALIQRKEVNESHYASAQFFNVTVGFILFILFYFSSGLLSKFYSKENLKSLFEAMSLLFIINAFGHIYRARLRRDLNFAIITKTTLAGVIVGGLLSIYLALNGFGIWSLVFQYLSSAFVSNLLLYYYLRGVKTSFSFSLKSLKELWNYGFKMFITNMIEVVVGNIDSLTIGKLFAPSVLGVYYRAKSLNTFVVEYSASSIMNVYFRVASHYQDNLVELGKIYNRISSMLFFTTNFMVGFLFLTNKEIITLVFGSKWIDASYYFDFIVISSLTLPVSYLTLNTLSGIGKSGIMLRLKIITRTIYLFNFIIGFSFGIKGFMIGLVFVNFINFGIELWTLSRYLNFDFLNKILKLGLQLITFSLLVFISHYLKSVFHLENNSFNVLLGFVIYSILFFSSAFLQKNEGLGNIVLELKKIRNKA
ncbi:MAG: lipopolysaccharide biosynthesis protein [Bacteroidia bacterium]